MSMNKKLGKIAKAEIKEAIGRCTTRNQRSAEAERLALHFGVSKSRIYEISKEDRPKQKTRADKGKRTADLMSHSGLKYAASLVVAYDITPAEALIQARLDGFEIPVELETFRRYLNEHEINAKPRRNGKTAYRSFEASKAGEMFQFDISGTKTRWLDFKTRKIVTISELEVSENHPNENPNRIKVWRFKILDDFSRLVFTRYYAVQKPSGSHVVDFLLQAYSELGVPETLYSDNDVVIKFAKNKAATKFIDKALEDVGGYKVIHHLPGNARATGKIERQHQESEKSEKLLGLFLARGRELTLDALQQFAVQKDAEYNNMRHRTTNMTPMARWNSRPHIVRKLDYQVLRCALLADEYDITIKGNLSFDLLGKSYQLPTDQNFQNLYERQQSTKKRCKVYFSPEADFYTLVDLDGNYFDCPKVPFAPDAAGEWKSNAESRGEKYRKELKQFAKAQANAEKERTQMGLESSILYFDTDNVGEIKEKLAAENKGILQFPTQTLDVTDQIIDSLPTGRAGFVKDGYAGQLLTWYDAVITFSDQFTSKAECKDFLDTIFSNRDDKQPEALIRDAINGLTVERPKLRIAN